MAPKLAARRQTSTAEDITAFTFVPNAGVRGPEHREPHAAQPPLLLPAPADQRRLSLSAPSQHQVVPGGASTDSPDESGEAGTPPEPAGPTPCSSPPRWPP